MNDTDVINSLSFHLPFGSPLEIKAIPVRATAADPARQGVNIFAKGALAKGDFGECNAKRALL
jgi:hypothetical protein